MGHVWLLLFQGFVMSMLVVPMLLIGGGLGLLCVRRVVTVWTRAFSLVGVIQLARGGPKLTCWSLNYYAGGLRVPFLWSESPEPL